MKRIVIMMLTINFLLSMPVSACTSILLKATDGTVIRSRSMEYSVAADYAVVSVPGNVQYNGLFPVSGKGLKWKGKYGVVGITFEALPGLTQMVSDGMNEKGLSCGELYFSESVGYTRYTNENDSRALAPWTFPQWVLSNFATLDEVKKALRSIVITDNEIQKLGLLPLHYIITDPRGDSIIVEPISGELKVWDNPLGSMTNNPPHDWHMTNLQNYLFLGNKNISSKEFKAIDGRQFAVKGIGSGNGYQSLPGDASSPSRFIRTVFYTQSAIPVNNAADLLNQSIGIMNNFFLVKGFIVEDVSATNPYKYGYSQWEDFCDQTNRVFYYRSYNNPIIRKIDLKRIDFSKQAVKVIPVDYKLHIIDLTDTMRHNPEK